MARKYKKRERSVTSDDDATEAPVVAQRETADATIVSDEAAAKPEKPKQWRRADPPTEPRTVKHMRAEFYRLDMKCPVAGKFRPTFPDGIVDIKWMRRRRMNIGHYLRAGYLTAIVEPAEIEQARVDFEKQAVKRQKQHNERAAQRRVAHDERMRLAWEKRDAARKARDRKAGQFPTGASVEQEERRQRKDAEAEVIRKINQANESKRAAATL